MHRAAVPDGKVVDTDHDDRVQDDDLTQEHDFVLGESRPNICQPSVTVTASAAAFPSNSSSASSAAPVIPTSDSAASMLHEDIVDTIGYLSTH